MIEKSRESAPPQRIHVRIDAEKLLADPEFRARQAAMHARMAELRKQPPDTLAKLRDKWLKESTPEEIAETYDYLMKALAENDY